MTTKENTAAALNFIHGNGLDNSSWNIETYPVCYYHYGNTDEPEKEIPPHIALYYDKEDKEASSTIYIRCDFALYSQELETLIFIYLL